MMLNCFVPFITFTYNITRIFMNLFKNRDVFAEYKRFFQNKTRALGLKHLSLIE